MSDDLKQDEGEANEGDIAALAHKVYLIGFPKSGLHLAEKWVQKFCAQATPKDQKPWLGNVRGNAWKLGWAEHTDEMPGIFAELAPGTYLKGHCQWRRDIAESLWNNHISTYFVYRNLRDVAVSAAFHVTDTEKCDDGRWKKMHFDKSLFKSMPMADLIIAMIRGHEEHAGIADRWRAYAPWLREKWVYHVRFEDMVGNPEETAGTFLRYSFGITGQWGDLDVTINRAEYDEAVAMMVEASNAGSQTFRRGKAGGWVDYWDGRIERAFRESGAYTINQRLGYE